MGGYGSGRWNNHAPRQIVEACRVISVSDLSRRGLLDGRVRTGRLYWPPHPAFERDGTFLYGIRPTDAGLVLLFRHTVAGRHGPEEAYQVVALQATRPALGGVRWWFTCPLGAGGVPCARRVLKLYLPPGGRVFGCRACHDLTYRCSQEAHRFDWLAAKLAASNPGLSADAVRRTFLAWGKQPRPEPARRRHRRQAEPPASG